MTSEETDEDFEDEYEEEDDSLLEYKRKTKSKKIRKKINASTILRIVIRRFNLHCLLLFEFRISSARGIL